MTSDLCALRNTDCTKSAPRPSAPSSNLCVQQTWLVWNWCNFLQGQTKVMLSLLACFFAFSLKKKKGDVFASTRCLYCRWPSSQARKRVIMKPQLLLLHHFHCVHLSFFLFFFSAKSCWLRLPSGLSLLLSSDDRPALPALEPR